MFVNVVVFMAVILNVLVISNMNEVMFMLVFMIVHVSVSMLVFAAVTANVHGPTHVRGTAMPERVLLPKQVPVYLLYRYIYI